MRRMSLAVLLIVIMAMPLAAAQPAYAQTGTPTRTPTSTPGGPNDPGNPGRITQSYATLVDRVIGVAAQSRYTLTLADHDVYDFKCSATGYNAAIYWQYGSGTKEGLFCNGATPATKVLRDDGRNLTIWLSMESSITENGSFSVKVRGWDDREIVTSGFTYNQSTIFNAYVEMLPLQKFDVRVQNPPATLTHITKSGTWPNGCSTIARYTTPNGLQYNGWGFCMAPQESQPFQVQSVEAGARFTNESGAYKENLDPGNNPDPLFRLDGQGFPPTPTATVGPPPTPANCRDYEVPSDGQPHLISDDWYLPGNTGSTQQFYASSVDGYGIVRWYYYNMNLPFFPGNVGIAGNFVSGSTWRFQDYFSGTNSSSDGGTPIAIPAILRVCLPHAFTPTPTSSSPTATPTRTPTSISSSPTATTLSMTSTPTTSSPTATLSSATGTPTSASTTGTATSGTLPNATPRPDPRITAVPAPTGVAGTLPDLGLVIPTLIPLTPVTATITISATAVLAAVQTIQAGLATPVAAVATASVTYSWETGQEIATAWSTTMQPALEWLAVLNPLNLGWTIVGGPLWALAPLILPMLPIIVAGLIVVFIRFFLWLYAWFLKLVDQIVKLIELIPGE